MERDGGAAAARRALRLIDDFLSKHESWVIEGCYGTLIEHVAPRATKLVFLNPGVERCVANCLARSWEPHKYASAEEQNARLAFLIEWVRQYETRDDEFSLARHRRIFDAFRGEKEEIG